MLVMMLGAVLVVLAVLVADTTSTFISSSNDMSNISSSVSMSPGRSSPAEPFVPLPNRLRASCQANCCSSAGSSSPPSPSLRATPPRQLPSWSPGTTASRCPTIGASALFTGSRPTWCSSPLTSIPMGCHPRLLPVGSPLRSEKTRSRSSPAHASAHKDKARAMQEIVNPARRTRMVSPPRLAPTRPLSQQTA